MASDGKSSDDKDDVSPPAVVTNATTATTQSQSSQDVENMMEILRQLIQDYASPSNDDLDNDEDLYCPLHLSRPSPCPTQDIPDCPRPLKGPKLSKSELLQAQALDDGIMPSINRHILEDALEPILESPSLNTVQTYILPILHEGVWSVLVLSYRDNDVTTQYHEPRINGQNNSVNLIPMIRAAVKATFERVERRRKRRFSWNRILSNPCSVKCKSMNRTSKSGSHIIELLAGCLSQELKLPKGSRASDAGKLWAARFERL